MEQLPKTKDPLFKKTWTTKKKKAPVVTDTECSKAARAALRELLGIKFADTPPNYETGMTSPINKNPPVNPPQQNLSEKQKKSPLVNKKKPEGLGEVKVTGGVGNIRQILSKLNRSKK